MDAVPFSEKERKEKIDGWRPETRRREGARASGWVKDSEGDRAEIGLKENTGIRKQRFRCGGEYHLLPKGSLKDTRRGDPEPRPPASRRGYRPPYPSISMESPTHVQERGFPSNEDLGSNCEQPPSATLDLGGQSIATGAERVAVSRATTFARIECWFVATKFWTSGAFHVPTRILHVRDPSLVMGPRLRYAAQLTFRLAMHGHVGISLPLRRRPKIR